MGYCGKSLSQTPSRHRDLVSFSVEKLFIAIEVQAVFSKCVGTVEVLGSVQVRPTEQ